MKRSGFACAIIFSIAGIQPLYAGPLDLPQVSGKPVAEEPAPGLEAIPLGNASKESTQQLPVRELERANTLINQNDAKEVQAPAEFEHEYDKNEKAAEVKTTGAGKDITSSLSNKTKKTESKNKKKLEENYNQ